MYFGNFSSVWYDLEDKQKYTLATNVLQRVGFRKRLKNEGDYFIEYNTKDTDRPEIIADKIYGDPNFHWVVLMFNEKLNPTYEWVMTPQELSDLFERKYTGTVCFMNSSDFKIKTGDLVGINRIDENGDWRLVGTRECLGTNKSLHKIILDGDVDYQVGDGLSLYASIQNYGEEGDPNYEYRKSSGEQQLDGIVDPENNGKYKNDPSYLSAATKNDILLGVPNDINTGTTGLKPDGGDCVGVCGYCAKIYKLRVTVKTEPKNTKTSSCTYSIHGSESSVCMPGTKGAPDEYIRVDNFEEIANDDGTNTMYFEIGVQVIGGRCACVGESNIVTKQYRGNVTFRNEWNGTTPGTNAESFFAQLVSDINPSIELKPCCTKDESTSHFNFGKPSLEAKENRWFGIDSSMFVDSLVRAYRKKASLKTVITDMSYGRQQYQRSLYDSGDNPEFITDLNEPVPILKIVLLPEKSLHHFENADGNTLNPFADESGTIFTGSVINPQPLPWQETLLYKYTQDNQLIDGAIIKAVSMEEYELDENEKKRPIRLLRPEYLDIAVKEIEQLLDN